MSLRDELGLRTDFESTAHEALLSLYLTAGLLRKRADEFLKGHKLTDAQFQLLLLLLYQSGPEGGLSQVTLARMMLVNRANVTALLDRLESGGWVTREGVEGDRRVKMVTLTAKGRRQMEKAERDYREEVNRIMHALTESEQRSMTKSLEKLRSVLRNDAK